MADRYEVDVVEEKSPHVGLESGRESHHLPSGPLMVSARQWLSLGLRGRPRRAAPRGSSSGGGATLLQGRCRAAGKLHCLAEEVGSHVGLQRAKLAHEVLVVVERAVKQLRDLRTKSRGHVQGRGGRAPGERARVRGQSALAEAPWGQGV